jgi:hypothetical protein
MGHKGKSLKGYYKHSKSTAIYLLVDDLELTVKFFIFCLQMNACKRNMDILLIPMKMLVWKYMWIKLNICCCPIARIQD